jgi:S-adenosylmethionine synthetase
MLSDLARAVRGVSDDRNVVVGHACGDERTNFLPVEQWLAHRLARRVWEESRSRRASSRA